MLTGTRTQPDVTANAAHQRPAEGRRTRLATSVAVGVLLAAVLSPVPAHAGDGAAQLQCEPAPADQPCTQHPGPVSTSGDAPQPCDSSGGEPSDCAPDYGVPGLDGCWYKLTEPTPETATAIASGTDAPESVWYIRTCGHGPARHSTLVRLAVPPADDLATLAQHGRLTLRLPPPAATVHIGPDLVGWPTWLWLADGSWQPITTTASAGGQSATITATPTLAVWQTGDGLAELCTGPGTAWIAGTGPSQASPDCGHVYAQPPADNTITVTVLWTVVASSSGTDIHLPPLSTTTTTIAADAPSGGPDQPGTGPEEPEPTP